MSQIEFRWMTYHSGSSSKDGKVSINWSKHPTLGLLSWTAWFFHIANGEPGPAKQAQSTLILLFPRLMQSPALSKQISQVFMERSYFTTKKHRWAPKSAQNVMALSWISVDSNVEVRRYGGQIWQCLVPNSFEHSLLVCLNRLARILAMMPDVEDVDHRICWTRRHVPAIWRPWLVNQSWLRLTALLLPTKCMNLSLPKPDIKQAQLSAWSPVSTKKQTRLFKHAPQIWLERYWQPLHLEHNVITIYISITERFFFL